MENEPLISVVVPVYNVQQFLNKCIVSILKQSYSNLQIILVDDGSTDNSGSQCDELASQDKRIIVIHKTNGGLSSARNEGMKKVSGEYVTFVDSDDFIGRRFIENLFNAARIKNAKIAITGLTKTSRNDIKEHLNTTPPEEVIAFSSEEAIVRSIKQDPFGEHACGKLYHYSLFPYLKFPEDLTFEDAFISFKILSKTERVAYENARDYYYIFDRPTSITNTLSLKYLDCLVSFYAVLDYARKNQPSAIPAAEKRFYGRLIRCFGITRLLGNEKALSKIFKTIKTERRYVILHSSTAMSTKCAFLLSYLGKTVCSYLAMKMLGK